MTFSRRDMMIVSAGAGLALVLPSGAMAATTDELVAAFTGGAAVADGGITLTAPEIAENGNTVPVTVDAPGASEVLLLATGNPNADVAIIKFGPLAGSFAASTRIRLAKTQDVMAVAKMADGSFAQAKSTVKVTIGGCGG
ncbi:MAG: thiosulfate oxidation carrier protein SoxY [Rhodobacteraceae bacterium]|nr:thiosulfate oxidation carrier protein SoxY [Paracoccaceae bacterium]